MKVGVWERGEWGAGAGSGRGGSERRQRLLVSGNEEEMTTPRPPLPMCALFEGRPCVRPRKMKKTPREDGWIRRLKGFVWRKIDARDRTTFAHICMCGRGVWMSGRTCGAAQS